MPSALSDTEMPEKSYAASPSMSSPRCFHSTTPHVGATVGETVGAVGAAVGAVQG